jgi:adenylate kinase family enzyme
MRRVLVIGISGAGKSTFSRALAAKTGLPLIHLDTEFWRPGWKITPREQWRAKVAELIEREAWIMDGSFGATLDLRLPRADTVVWFDYPRHACLRRALWRVATTYGRVREDLAPGCPEKLDLEFLRYIWDFNANSRPQIVTMLAQHGRHLDPVVFRRDRDVARYLDGLQVN